MKYFIRIILCSFILISYQCEDTNKNTITLEQLKIKKQEILAYISTFSCSGDANCKTIAFGAKPCGGPVEYLVYPNTVDYNTLEKLVNAYYNLNQQYNIQTNAVSDCMFVNPPKTIGCVDGVCTIID